MKRIVSVALSLFIMVTSTVCAQSMSVLSGSSAGAVMSREDLQAINELSVGSEWELSSSGSSSAATSNASSSDVSSVSSSVSSVAKSSTPSTSSKKQSSSSSKPASTSPVDPGSSTQPTPSQPLGDVYQTAVMGGSVASAEQMATYLLKNNPSPRINGTVWDLVNYYLSEGAAEGVRGDIAFCQAIHETGWFKYGGQVQPYQNNYCGLGALNGGAQGASFDTPQLGVRAQIQHLKAYGSTGSLVYGQIDPRFHLVSRGIAPRWIDLSGKWACPGYSTSVYGSLDAAIADHADYGSRILTKDVSMINTAVSASLVQRAMSVSFSAS